MIILGVIAVLLAIAVVIVVVVVPHYTGEDCLTQVEARQQGKCEPGLYAGALISCESLSTYHYKRDVIEKLEIDFGDPVFDQSYVLEPGAFHAYNTTATYHIFVFDMNLTSEADIFYLDKRGYDNFLTHNSFSPEKEARGVKTFHYRDDKCVGLYPCHLVINNTGDTPITVKESVWNAPKSAAKKEPMRMNDESLALHVCHAGEECIIEEMPDESTVFLTDRNTGNETIDITLLKSYGTNHKFMTPLILLCCLCGAALLVVILLTVFFFINPPGKTLAEGSRGVMLE